jgi:hypothetical protein
LLSFRHVADRSRRSVLPAPVTVNSSTNERIEQYLCRRGAENRRGPAGTGLCLDVKKCQGDSNDADLREHNKAVPSVLEAILTTAAFA